MRRARALFTCVYGIVSLLQVRICAVLKGPRWRAAALGCGDDYAMAIKARRAESRFTCVT